MPVVGPGEVSDKRVEDVYRAVLDFLAEKHYIHVEVNDVYEITPFPLVEEHREKVLGEFKECIKNICQLSINLSW